MQVRPLDVALRYEGVRESGGRNRGPEVDRFLKIVGLDASKGGVAGYPWCCAFASTCILEAHQESWNLDGNVGPFDKKQLPVKLSAGVFEFWNKAPANRKMKTPIEGCAFIIDHGMNKAKTARLGHIGLVVSIDGDEIHTIEANTNGAGSREGDGVYQKIRLIKDCYGFVNIES